MTRDIIETNRLAIINELRATKRDGIEDLIALMDRYGFFEARCDSHDNSDGGAANHSLWVLWFARQEYHEDLGFEMESLTLACLCHDICDCSYPGFLGHGKRSRAILEKSKCSFEGFELAAIETHSEAPTEAQTDSTTTGAQTDSTTTEAQTDSTTTRAQTDGTTTDALTMGMGDDAAIQHLLQKILYEADHLSVEFCDCMPFGATPLPPEAKKLTDTYIDVICDPDDHRMWVGAEGWNDIFDGSETLSTFQVHQLMSLSTREARNSEDVLVFSDDTGMYAMTFLDEEEPTPLFVSDRVMFGYTDLIFYISRYPQYRSSYIAARNGKGKWGVYRIHENRKHNGLPAVSAERIIEFTFRDASRAIASMTGKTGRRIGIMDERFYSRIDLSPQTF